MKVTIQFLKKEREIEMKEGSTIADALKKIEINPETVIVNRGGEIVTDSEKLKSGEKIEAIRIVSGG